MPLWVHSALSLPLDPWDRSGPCHPSVQLDHSAPWVLTDLLRLWGLWDHSGRSLLPDQRDPMDLLRLWILPGHWDQRDRRGPSHPLAR